MELTQEKLEQILNTELVGKDIGYSHWTLSGVALRVIRILAKDAGLNEYDFNYDIYKGSNNTISLTYKKHSFGEVSFKKKKGKYHYGRYEWTFDKIFVNFWNRSSYASYNGMTFQQMLDAIDAEVIKSEKAKEDKKAHGKKVIKLLKDTYNLDDYGVRQLIDYLNSNKYSLTN